MLHLCLVGRRRRLVWRVVIHLGANAKVQVPVLAAKVYRQLSVRGERGGDVPDEYAWVISVGGEELRFDDYVEPR